jgi:hypothetical protein
VPSTSKVMRVVNAEHVASESETTGNRRRADLMVLVVVADEMRWRPRGRTG